MPVHESLSRTWHVVAPDLPGYGHSLRMDWARHPRDFASVLNALLDRLGFDHDVTLVGLGFGGWIAAEMLVQDSHRFAKATLVGPMGIQPPSGEYLDQMMLQHSRYVKEGFAEAEAFEALFGDGDDPAHVALWESARETTARIAWKPYMYSLQLPNHLANVTTPTQVISGNRDKIVPLSVAKAYAEKMPNCSLVRIPSGGHWLDIESPSSVVDEITRFAR